jgi:anaerobic selenocysteine-containing dehydrogenase
MNATTTHKSICRSCATSCPVIVEVEGQKVVSLRGNKQSPLYHGYCCSRGQAVPQEMNSPNRLLRPMKRLGSGEYAQIPSELALDEITASLRRVIEQHGPDRVAVYIGTLAVNYPMTPHLGVAFMNAIGSHSIYSANTIDQGGRDIAWDLVGGWEGGAYGFADSDVWMIFGANPLISMACTMPVQNPGRILNENLTRGLKLIVIDPRRTQTAARAHLHIRPRPGEDTTIVAGLIREVLARGLEDKEFVAENVAGTEALRKAVEPFTLDYVAARAQVPAQQIAEAARLYATLRRGNAVGATGFNMSCKGSLNEYLLQCLNSICGKFIRAGERVPSPGVLLPMPIPKAQAMAPRPALFPQVAQCVRGLSLSSAGMPSGALAEEMMAGRVKAMITLGSNIALSLPDQPRMIQALKSLDLLVHFDVKMSVTARFAHYVIPTKMGMEVPATSYVSEMLEMYSPAMAMYEPFGYYAPKVVDPPAGSDLMEEWELFYGVGQRMGLPLRLSFPPSHIDRVRQPRPSVDLNMTTKPTTDQLYEFMTAGSRIPLSEVKKHEDGALFPETVIAAPKDPNCNARLDVGNGPMLHELAEVFTDDRLRKLKSEFPFMLVCRRMPHVYNSMGQDNPLLIKKARTGAEVGGMYNPAYMHPSDISALGIRSGDPVSISSNYGSIPGVVQPDETLIPGLVSMAHNFGGLPGEDLDFRKYGSNTSVLTDNTVDFDRYTGQPRMSAIPVRVTKYLSNYPTAPQAHEATST